LSIAPAGAVIKFLLIKEKDDNYGGDNRRLYFSNKKIDENNKGLLLDRTLMFAGDAAIELLGVEGTGEMWIQNNMDATVVIQVQIGRDAMAGAAPAPAPHNIE